MALFKLRVGAHSAELWPFAAPPWLPIPWRLNGVLEAHGYLIFAHGFNIAVFVLLTLCLVRFSSVLTENSPVVCVGYSQSVIAADLHTRGGRPKPLQSPCASPAREPYPSPFHNCLSPPHARRSSLCAVPGVVVAPRCFALDWHLGTSFQGTRLAQLVERVTFT